MIKIFFCALILFLVTNFCSAQNSDASAADSVETKGIFVVVEEPATFPGGFAKFYEYVEKNKSKKVSRQNKTKGKVLVEFVINKDGSIDRESVKTHRGLNPSCDEEAIRLIKECPDWNPGRSGGQAVKQKFVIPINFN